MAATARNRLFSSSSEDEEGSGTEPHQQKTPASRRPAGTSGKFSTKKPDSLSPELIELNGIYDRYNYRLTVIYSTPKLEPARILLLLVGHAEYNYFMILGAVATRSGLTATPRPTGGGGGTAEPEGATGGSGRRHGGPRPGK